MKIQNYDVEDDEKNDFIQLHDFMPDRCFRCLVSAPSGSGKTNLPLDMIYKLLYFDKIYLYVRNLQQSKYKHLLKSLEPISKQVGYDVIEASNDEIIPLTDLPEENQKIVIFDDYLNTGKKNDERIRDYFTNSRNKNCCCIYLSQSFNNTEKTIRLNRNYITAPHPINSDHVCTKGYTDDEISKISNVDSTQFVKKTGDTMGGDLILQPQPYPIQGNTHKGISYNTTRAIFLSRKEGGAMETDLDVNNNFIVNVKDPVNIDHGVNKKYVDD